jgi:hypothetical protein
MACDGYYYGQCANGVWVVRKCADGLACFTENGAVYCDWASNGVITSCSDSSSSKMKRDTEDYGAAFVSGDSSGTMYSSSTDTSGVVSGTIADLPEEATTGASLESDLTIYGTEYTDVTITGGTTVTDDLIQVTPIPYLFDHSISSMDVLTGSNFTSTTLATSLAVVFYSNTTSLSSTISDFPSSGPTPPTNISLSVQPLNNTNFVAVLQASTLNNTPILTDWSFSFKSLYRILQTDRGNLTMSQDLTTYTITSIPIQEPAVNMAVVVRLSGVYDSSTSSGMVGVSGVENANLGSSGNGSLTLFKRTFAWLT